MHEYKAGMAIPKISAATQKKENAINTKQRDYENRIRHFREEALIFREIDPMQAKRARANAIRLNKEYKRFSAENGRAFYPDRVKNIKRLAPNRVLFLCQLLGGGLPLDIAIADKVA